VFFDNVRDGNLYPIELDNEIQKLTNNYDLDKLNMLLSGFRYYYREMIDKELSQYSNEQLNDLIDDYKKSGWDKPMIKLRSKIEEPEDSKPNEAHEYVKLVFPENYLDGCENFIKLLNELMVKHSSSLESDFIDTNNKPTKSKKKLTEPLWFQVGMQFANGTLFNLCEEKQKLSWEKISDKVFKTKSRHNYISFSFNNNVGLDNENASKNIFIYPKKIQKIKAFCEKNKISIDQRFLNRIKPE
jgi:hypothetical protein